MTSSKRSQGCFRWTGRIVAGALGLLMILAVSGLAYQLVASWKDRQAYPPPGRMVDVGGYRLHLHCLGTGEPTVILEAGLPMSSLHWSPVLEELVALTTVCAFDRAGLGWSDPSPVPLNSRAVAIQLHKLLTNADIPGPYILVGHSVGGLHVRNFAQLYPAEVSGIVLVDSSHENQHLRLPPGFALQRNPQAGLLCPVLAPVGVFRMFKVYEQQLASSPLSTGDKLKIVANRKQTHFCQAQLNEEIAAEVDLSQPTPPSSLGDLPLTVISAGIGLSGADPAMFPFTVTYEDLINADRVHLALQRELAALSTNSTQIVADESSHNIHHDQPDLVIGAVLQMVSMNSPGTPPNPPGQNSGDLR